jgi:hypothetical protein
MPHDIVAVQNSRGFLKNKSGVQQKVAGIAEGSDATAEQYRRFMGSFDRPDAKERRRNCSQGIERQT